MEVDGSRRKLLEVGGSWNGRTWKSMEVDGSVGKLMEVFGSKWKSMEVSCLLYTSPSPRD